MFNDINSSNYVKEKGLNETFLLKTSKKEPEKSLDILDYYVMKNDITLLTNVFSISNFFYEKDLTLGKSDLSSFPVFPSILVLREKPRLYPSSSKEDMGNLSSVSSEDNSCVAQPAVDQTTSEEGVSSFISSSSEKLVILLDETMNSISSLYPAEYSAFSSVLSKLNGIMTSLPSLSEEEIVTLNQLPIEINRLMIQQNLPVTFRSLFCNSVKTIYTDVVISSKTLAKTLSQNLQQTQNQQDLFQQIQNSITTFLAFVSPGNYQNALKISDVSQMSQILTFIGSVFNSLVVDEQKIITDALTPALNRSSFSSSLTPVLLENVLTDVWAYNLISVLVAEDPKITQVEALDKITTSLSPYIASLFSPISDMAKAVLSIIENSGAGTAVSNVYQFSEGMITMNSQFYSTITSSPGLINGTDIMGLAANQNLSVVFNLEAGQIISDNTVAMNSLQKAATQLTNFVAIQTEGLHQSRGQAVFLLPLPSAIATVLLDHYMPEEVDYLQTLSESLYYSNVGSKMESAILENISNYINAGSYFNFASIVGPPDPLNPSFPGQVFYSIDFSLALKRLESEQQQTTNYITTTRKALDTIDQQIALIQADSKISSTNKAQLINVLNKNKNNFTNILNNLIAAQNLLNQINLANPGISGKTIVDAPDNWQPQLQDLETNLVTGNNGVGGMFSSMASLQASQQSYADDGQNQQLELQLHLTTMQQEWTVIATSLQILNQIYLGLARNILQ